MNAHTHNFPIEVKSATGSLEFRGAAAIAFCLHPENGDCLNSTKLFSRNNFDNFLANYKGRGSLVSEANNRISAHAWIDRFGNVHCKSAGFAKTRYMENAMQYQPSIGELFEAVGKKVDSETFDALVINRFNELNYANENSAACCGNWGYALEYAIKAIATPNSKYLKARCTPQGLSDIWVKTMDRMNDILDYLGA